MRFTETSEGTREEDRSTENSELENKLQDDGNSIAVRLLIN